MIPPSDAATTRTSGCALALPPLLLAASLFAGPARAQEAGRGGTRSLRALPLAELGSGPDASARTIEVDGRLEEEAWRRAPAATGFRQRNPDEGEPATEGTEVRLVYGREALYVGVLARDREPRKIIGRILERDRLMRASPFGGGLRFRGDHGVAVLFDAFHDHRSAMVFATNPNGAKFEALVTDEGQQINVEWRAVWRVEARRHSRGWSAEFELPFTTLRYPSTASGKVGPAGNGSGAETAGQTWGFNVFRMIRRKNEQALWSSWSRENQGFTRVSDAGHLTGLRALPRSGLNLQVEPYALAGASEARTGGGRRSDTRWELGATAKYELRPGLVLDLTGNPDFAQVEVDREQVNLTRFKLFFPEKRDFFLENAGIFDFGLRGFGPQPPPFLLFFSRRVGLHRGEQVPVLAGARLTGRMGGQTVGVLDVVTDEAAGVSRSNHAVVRVKRDVGDSGYLGAMVTDLRRGLGGGPTGAAGAARNDSVAGHNTAGGIDWSLWPGDRLNLQGFLAGTGTGGSGGDDAAYRLAADYSSDFVNFRLGHLFIGDEANADMGFITRRDARRTDAFFMLTPRPEALGLRAVNAGLSGQHFAGEDWTVQDWEFGPFVSPEWDSGEDLRLIFNRSFTRLRRPFRLAERVTVPPGDYDMWQLNTRLATSSNRPLWGELRFRYRRFFDGTLLAAGGNLNLRAGKHLGFEARYRHNDVEGPWGAFTSNVAALRVRYSLSTELSADAVVQYNSLEDRLNTNVRLRLIHRPGSDLFVVFSEERGPGPGSGPAALAPAGARPAIGPRPGLERRRLPPVAPSARAAVGSGTGGSPWDLRSRQMVVKLTYLLRL